MTEQDRKSALFALLVQQQSSMAFMFMGHTPHPDTGKPIFDLGTAQTFIDQMEVLAEKTRGNLTDEEGRLLQGTLSALRMAYVEAVQKGGPPEEDASPAPADASAKPSGDADAATSEASQSAPSGEEPHKKYSKKY